MNSRGTKTKAGTRLSSGRAGPRFGDVNIVGQGAKMGIPGSGNSRELPGIPGVQFFTPGERERILGETGKTRQLQWTRQTRRHTRFVLWAGSGQTDAPGACLTVLRYPSTRQSHWKCLSGFGEAAPARLPADLPYSREFPPGAGIPGSSREFPTPRSRSPGIAQL